MTSDAADDTEAAVKLATLAGSPRLYRSLP
jgi:hypothetical protein